MKKLISILLSVIMICSLSACKKEKTDLEKYGFNYRADMEKPVEGLTFGMCHSGYSADKWYGIDYYTTTALIENMGAKLVRIWMHCNWLMEDPNTYQDGMVEYFRDMIDDAKSHGFEIIVMNHSNFHKDGLPNSAESVAKPSRDMSEGSYYLSWLKDYETTWYNMVRQFPDVKYWEIDNECNLDTFFKRLEGGAFSLEEKAKIYTDMMYFASQGIHRANPNAVTVMGGLVTSTAEAFLEYIYENIKAPNSWSPYPDDYFQVAAWHPYMVDYAPKKWENQQKNIYNVIKTNEGKDKKVFFTEMGWSEGDVPTEEIGNNIRSTYGIIKESLDFVESACYFTMTDNLSSSWSATREKYFGMFYDPTPTTSSIEWAQDGYVKGGAKPYALIYQELAGGTGSLDLLLNYVRPN